MHRGSGANRRNADESGDRRARPAGRSASPSTSQQGAEELGRMTGPLDYLLVILYTLPGAAIGLVLHELAHSVIVLRAGDTTPLRENRMTLDPVRQLDPFGFPALLISGFGWGRPVLRDARSLRRPAQRSAVVAAGPVAHLIVAAIF